MKTPSQGLGCCRQDPLKCSNKLKKRESLTKFRRVFSSQSALQGEVASENLLGQQMH